MPETTDATTADSAAELLACAERCDRLADDHAEDNPLWARYLALKARHLRRLARDLEDPEA